MPDLVGGCGVRGCGRRRGLVLSRGRSRSREGDDGLVILRQGLGLGEGVGSEETRLREQLGVLFRGGAAAFGAGETGEHEGLRWRFLLRVDVEEELEVERSADEREEVVAVDDEVSHQLVHVVVVEHLQELSGLGLAQSDRRLYILGESHLIIWRSKLGFPSKDKDKTPF